MDLTNKKFALITGASSGLGTDFARNLAKRGINLVLVARRLERLEAIKNELVQAYNITVEVFSFDLSDASAPLTLYQNLQEKHIHIDILINNAGYGLFGDDSSLPWSKIENMLMLNIMTVVHLTKLFSQEMIKKGGGYILQISSVGAYQPTPTYAAYSASKAFVLLYGEALNEELRCHNIKVTVLSPGITATEFLQVSGQKATLYQRLLMMQSDTVANIGITAMLKGKQSVIPGFMNQLIAFSLRFTPRTWMNKIAGVLMKND